MGKFHSPGQAAKVTFGDATYAVVSREDLRPVNEVPDYDGLTHTQATHLLAETVRDHPRLDGALVVVASYELEGIRRDGP